MLRRMQPLIRPVSVSTWSSTIIGKVPKVETNGAAKG